MAEKEEFTHEEDRELITSLLANFDCLPVLFIGAGLSRRYFDAPDWEHTLRNALQVIGDHGPRYEYLSQKFGGDLVEIGTAIADSVFEWAWSEGKSQFDESLFKSDDKSIFLKNIVASQLIDITPDKKMKIDKKFANELKLFQKIIPHALITTNYDDFLEKIFIGYEAIVGKGVLRYNLNSFGEIFHIHGTVDRPDTMVLVKEDYDVWDEESRYFASKLLTYFVEHPIFIFGYGLGDPNIKTVLSDIGRIVAGNDGLIANVVQVVWSPDEEGGSSQSEHVVSDGDKQYRIRVLNVDSFERIFELLSAQHELKDINPALVRALAARVMKLTRRDIPNGEVQVNYESLEKISADENELPTMLGLTVADDLNKAYPFTLSMAADELGEKNWQQLQNKALKQIEDEKGINIKESDNRYHCDIKTGKNSRTHKYSHEALGLFQKILNGEDYVVNL